MADGCFQFLYLCYFGFHELKAGFPFTGGQDFDVNMIGFPFWVIQTLYDQPVYQAQWSGFHRRR